MARVTFEGKEYEVIESYPDATHIGGYDHKDRGYMETVSRGDIVLVLRPVKEVEDGS